MHTLPLVATVAAILLGAAGAAPAAEFSDVASLRQLMPRCALGPVPTSDEFDLLYLIRGQTLSNILMDDEPSSIIRVSIASGPQPITVVLVASGRVIFDFEGDVERVRRVVAVTQQLAVRGVAPDRVELVRRQDCDLAFVVKRFDDGARAHRDVTLRDMFGRAPDQEIVEQDADTVILRPDWAAATQPPIISKREDAQRPRVNMTPTDRKLYDSYAGGFRQLDAASLVTASKLTVPETYPDGAGLIQLEQRGDIRAPTQEERAAWIEGASRPYRSKFSPDFRLTVEFDYIVVRSIRLPASARANFLVAAGIADPRSQQRDCIAFMDGFRISPGLCLREWGEIETLRELTDAPDPGTCRLLSAPDDAAIEGVAVYEPAGAQHSGNEPRTPMPIDVRVSRPGAVLLVLNANEPAIWRISPAAATRIVGVLLNGHYASRAEGLPPDTPIVAIDHERQRGQPPPSPACAPFMRLHSTAYAGGPRALALDRQVSALVGRRLDGLRGAYSLRQVDIP